MAGFAALEDYAIAYPGTLTEPSEIQQVQRALDSACEDIRRYCNQQFDKVEGDVIAVHGNGKPVLLLPELPIISVNSVTIDKDLPTEISITDFRVDRDGQLYRPPVLLDTIPDWAWDWWGAPSWVALNLGWPKGFGNVTVDYDHGYDTGAVPSNLVNVAVTLARNIVTAPPLTLRGEHIGGYSYTRYEGYEGVNEFSDVLDRYTINRIPVA